MSKVYFMILWMLFSRVVDNPDQQLAFLLHGYEKFEEHIGYRFRDRSYLLQVTHPVTPVFMLLAISYRFNYRIRPPFSGIYACLLLSQPSD